MTFLLLWGNTLFQMYSFFITKSREKFFEAIPIWNNLYGTTLYFTTKNSPIVSL